LDKEGKMGTLLLGTCGYSDKEWVGFFTSSADFLETNWTTYGLKDRWLPVIIGDKNL
jgi:hypothetical protein